MWPAQQRTALHSVAAAHAPRRARAALAAVATGAARAVLVLAICAGGAVGVALLVLLLSVASPIAAILLAWIVVRSERDTRTALARVRARWGRSAHVIAGGLER